ncbi:hypothetical protein L1049_026825 [Liquidambar formosana]|uniref:Small auxin up regulated protein n=1 Tax=Liquidambar formosana TaxID=63359 RepID=A0AAP0NG80_LIQFO
MINPKRLVEMVQKKQRKAASLGRRRRRISLPRRNGGSQDQNCKRAVAQKGHFVVYSIDKKRFVVPLQYLNHNIFRDLFKMSEEEFGLPATGPITLPCDAAYVEYVISLIQRHASEDLQKALLISMVDDWCFDIFYQFPVSSE